LIIRGRRGIKFTPEGEYIAQRAKEIIEQHDKIERHVLNMKNDFSGVLKIGASKYIAKYKLPKLLRFFKERFPNIECEVITGWSGDISRKLRDREVDVAFIRADYPWHGSRVTLFEEEMWAVYTEEFEWEDLLEIPFIKYENDPRVSMIIEDWWHSNFNQSPNIDLYVDQVDTCKEMIINGLGFGIVPSLIFDGVPDIYIKPLTKDNRPITRKTWLYYHSEDIEMTLIKTFVDFVDEHDIKAL